MRQILDDDIHEGGSLADEGWHHVEVRECREKRSAAGDLYYNLELVDVRTKDLVAYDIAMMQGRGNGMGIKKLEAIGAAQRNDAGNGWVVTSPDQIAGLRAFAHVHHDEYEWEGEKRTRTKVSIKEGHMGYRPESSPPEGFEQGDDTPF